MQSLLLKVGIFYFYPRSPCGERPCPSDVPVMSLTISIHALLAESDPKKPNRLELFLDFYPRSPCGERLCCGCSGRCRYWISIHALLAESDLVAPLLATGGSRYFYPRSPCGERHCNLTQKRHPLTISIHALLAESDPLIFSVQPRKTISIHALLAESDNRRPIFFGQAEEFLSTLSLRRATGRAL